MRDAPHVKIRFRLEQDEDGWPPTSVESMWAVDLGNKTYRIDNIPFYAKGVSDGDVVSATFDEGVLWFDRVLSVSGQSTFRVIVFEQAQVQAVRDELRAMGCTSELSDSPKLFVLNIPTELDIRPIASYLEAGEQAGRWEFEEGALRHRDSGFSYLSS